MCVPQLIVLKSSSVVKRLKKGAQGKNGSRGKQGRGGKETGCCLKPDGTLPLKITIFICGFYNLLPNFCFLESSSSFMDQLPTGGGRWRLKKGTMNFAHASALVRCT